MNHSRLMIAMLAAAVVAGVLPGLPPEPLRPVRRCLRPGCPNGTRHNGGYCSAACCAAHRAEGSGLAGGGETARMARTRYEP